MGLMQSLARLITPRQKANPAGEGNYHPGPYTMSDGWLPSSWGQYLNYWQMDYDPLPYPSCSIVEACVWCYIRAIAQLPGYHQRELDNGGTETVTTSALSRLLRSPNEYQTTSDFLTHLIRSLLLRGNSYWIAERNDRREVVALHWTDPNSCRVREVRVQGQPATEIFYEIGNNPLLSFDSIASHNLIAPARDVLHIKLATPRHPLIGETWLTAAYPEIANHIAIQQSLRQLNTTMRPTGVIEGPPEITLTQAQMEEYRERWNKQVTTVGGVPILQRGFKFHPIAMSIQDQQVIEQVKLDKLAIAGLFGVPPILLGIADTSTQKSAEAVMSEWLASGLGWLVNHIEVSIDKFIGLNAVPAGREWAEFETEALLRSLFKEKVDGFARSVQSGIHGPNDARRAFGLPDAKDGDEPRVQQQMVKLSYQPPAPPAPAAPAKPPAANDDDEPAMDDDDLRAMIVARIERSMTNARTA